MPCPNCTHSMAGLGGGWFHCERCGTSKRGMDVVIPKLVSRCQEFGETLGPQWFKLWRQLGIEEALYPPEARRPT